MNTVVPLPRPPFEDGGTGKEGTILPALTAHLKGTGAAIQKTPGQRDTILIFSFLSLCKTDFFFFSQRQVYLILVTLTLSLNMEFPLCLCCLSLVHTSYKM